MIAFKTLNKLFIVLCACFSLTTGCKSNAQEEYQRGFQQGYANGLKDCNTIDRPKSSGQKANQTAKNKFKKQNNNTTIQGDAIPDYVLKTLSYIKENDAAPPGYVGGRTFGNYEKRLPIRTENNKIIKYQEWDVFPKVRGKNRGAERLVTGDDDRNWYTRDHYNTFIQIQE